MTAPLLIPCKCRFDGQWGWELVQNWNGVPAPFWCDGATIPAPAWQIICPPSDPRIMAAAVNHDWPYTYHDRPRKQADEEFVEAMRESEFKGWQRDSVWVVLREFGRSHWENNEHDLAYIEWLKPQITISNFDPQFFYKLGDAS